MRMTRADILQDTYFSSAVFSVVRADDDEVVTRVKGYIGKLFVFFHVLFHSFYLCIFQIRKQCACRRCSSSLNSKPHPDGNQITFFASDAGTCDSVSSSTTCGDDASSYYTSFTYNGKRVIISNQVGVIVLDGREYLKKCSTCPSIGA